MPDRDHFVSVAAVVERFGDAAADWVTETSGSLVEAFPAHELVLVVTARAADERMRLRSMVDAVPNVHLLFLAHGTDADVALTAGLDHAIGDVVVSCEPVVDPPSAIAEVAHRVASGTDVVYGVDTARSHGFLYRWMASRWHRYIERKAGIAMPMVDFALRGVSRRVLNTWLGNQDRDRLIRIMPAMSGFPWTTYEYRGVQAAHRQRSLRDSIRTGARTMLNATPSPLRFATFLALLAGVLNLAYALLVVVIALLRGHVVEGWLSMSLQSSGMFFLVSLVLAIMSEYLFQVVQRTHERPMYRVTEEASSPALKIRARLNIDHAARDA